MLTARLYRVQVRTTNGTWQDASGPLPMRSCKAMRAFFVPGTVARTVFHG